MSKQKHTAGLLIVDSHFCDDDRVLRIAMPNSLAGVPGASIAHCESNWHDAGPQERRISFIEAQANAARLVKCWNALEGLNPDAVADVVAALEGLTPKELCGESWGLPDGEVVPITITFGALKAARAAIAAAKAQSS